MLWFSAADVDALLASTALIDLLEKAFLDLANGRIVEHDASTLREESLGANYVAYVALWKEAGLASVKVLTAVDSNGTRGLPLIDAVVVAIDAETGRIVAILDGNRITARRTAAVSAIAVRHLAAADSKVLGIVGTGMQAIAHAEKLPLVRDFTRILIASAGGDTARTEKAAQEIQRRTGRTVEPVETAELAAADVIACCSLSRRPLFDATRVRPEATITCVSRFTPDAAEFDPRIAQDAAIVVADAADRATARWPSQPPWRGKIRDLSDVIAGQAALPAKGRRLFLSGGRAFEDLVSAKLVIEAAKSRGLGQTLS